MTNRDHVAAVALGHSSRSGWLRVRREAYRMGARNNPAQWPYRNGRNWLTRPRDRN